MLLAKKHASLFSALVVIITLLYSVTTASQTATTIDYTPYMQKLTEIVRRDSTVFFASMIIDNKSGKVLCTGFNKGNSHNPVMHGEISAITACAKKYKNNMPWQQSTLITTAEPCPMCQGAISWANLSRVVYGTSIPYLIEQGWRQIDIRAYELAKKSNFNDVEIIAGVLSSETNRLYNKSNFKKVSTLSFGSHIVERSLFKSAGKKNEKLALCAYCHGQLGLGDMEFGEQARYGTPALRGLEKDYMSQQFVSFKSGDRQHRDMKLLANLLNAQDKNILLEHYSSMPIKVDFDNKRNYDPLLVAKGKSIAEIADNRNIHCSQCHQKEKEKSAPRLAGQGALYIFKQLQLWKTSKRVSGTDNTMYQISNKLSTEELRAVAVYYESLGWN